MIRTILTIRLFELAATACNQKSSVSKVVSTDSPTVETASSASAMAEWMLIDAGDTSIYVNYASIRRTEHMIKV